MKNLLADETLIGLNVTAKHYCNCLFVSELTEEYCKNSYDEMLTVALRDQEFVEQFAFIEYIVNAEENEIQIKFDKYEISAKYSISKGCYFNN